jgi:hypothetical protein
MEETRLTRAQEAYRRAVEIWVLTIREEESLISADSSLAQVDTWKGCHFRESVARNAAKRTRKEYEAALRQAHAPRPVFTMPPEIASRLPRMRSSPDRPKT